jgi:hypothetical protein
LLDRAADIQMNEVNPHSLLGLELGLAQLPTADRARVGVLAGPAGAACLAADGAQVVIADPPRKGLDPALTEHLRQCPPERFVYVSCGLESFRDDIGRLTATGKLRMAALTAFNLLPFTEHVETVAVLERA